MELPTDVVESSGAGWAVQLLLYLAECNGSDQAVSPARIGIEEGSIVMRTGRFYQWLVGQDDGHDPMGLLASAVRADEEFPKWVASKSSAREYLQSRSAVSESLDALDQAWEEFEKTQWGI